jgi:hypothetical protein
VSDVSFKITSLQNNRDKGGHKKYIKFIRYPRFRNLEDNSRIDFNFPITFLVGKMEVVKVLPYNLYMVFLKAIV